ncbi:hypothetical protein JCM10212_000861, partial [Sporobolomyces blumeae]
MLRTCWLPYGQIPRATRTTVIASTRRCSSALSTLAPLRVPDSRWSGWTPKIGIELHVQLKHNLKLFSRALAQYDARPNSHVALIDAAFPGSLPVLRPESVRLALLACLAFECDINRASTFDRKHYFYPDQPAGYQITQKYAPLAKGGVIRVQLEQPQSKKKKKKSKQDSGQVTERDGGPEPKPRTYLEVRLDQVQLEQDTAKSFHDPDSNGTLVDLNRCGAALIEIVTLPDLSTPEEAGQFVKTIQQILRHVGVSDANMDKGELRVDVNVSVTNDETGLGGTRCEIKNLNGVRFVVGAIESEIQRQISLLSTDPPTPVVQSTLGYDAVEDKTFVLRTKESAVDYRYMPDPELGVVRIPE